MDDHLCPICLSLFYDPHSLPCKHVFCKDCVQQVARTYPDQTPACPICRTAYAAEVGAVLQISADPQYAAFLAASFPEVYRQREVEVMQLRDRRFDPKFFHAQLWAMKKKLEEMDLLREYDNRSKERLERTISEADNRRASFHSEVDVLRQTVQNYATIESGKEQRRKMRELIMLTKEQKPKKRDVAEVMREMQTKVDMRRQSHSLSQNTPLHFSGKETSATFASHSNMIVSPFSAASDRKAQCSDASVKELESEMDRFRQLTTSLSTAHKPASRQGTREKSDGEVKLPMIGRSRSTSAPRPQVERTLLELQKKVEDHTRWFDERLLATNK